MRTCRACAPVVLTLALTVAANAMVNITIHDPVIGREWESLWYGIGDNPDTLTYEGWLEGRLKRTSTGEELVFAKSSKVVFPPGRTVYHLRDVSIVESRSANGYEGVLARTQNLPPDDYQGELQFMPYNVVATIPFTVQSWGPVNLGAFVGGENPQVSWTLPGGAKGGFSTVEFRTWPGGMDPVAAWQLGDVVHTSRNLTGPFYRVPVGVPLGDSFVYRVTWYQNSQPVSWSDIGLGHAIFGRCRQTRTCPNCPRNQRCTQQAGHGGNHTPVPAHLCQQPMRCPACRANTTCGSGNCPHAGVGHSVPAHTCKFPVQCGDCAGRFECAAGVNCGIAHDHQLPSPHRCHRGNCRLQCPHRGTCNPP